MGELSYGEQAVGLTFNPSNNPNVQRIKELYAEIINICNQLREEDKLGEARATLPNEKVRLFSIAITEAQTAQMWAVKAITW